MNLDLYSSSEGVGSLVDILERDGLSVELLSSLSYESKLGINLKSNLHHFDGDLLLSEISDVIDWYDGQTQLFNLALDYRVKSYQSSFAKYKRYYPDHQARKVFDDLLGFRSLCSNYDSVLCLNGEKHFRLADMSRGKANDDGYRGVHVYFQLDNRHYPIEIQYNTYYDRQMNNWLHKYLYKKGYPLSVGAALRKAYEAGKIITETDFQEEMNNVLCSSETRR